MAYRMEGLTPGPFRPLFRLEAAELAARQARRVVADGPGYLCRVSLAEAEAGETLLLVNHHSQPADSPYRACHAIYVRSEAETAVHVDQLPPPFESRTLSLRAFDGEAMLKGAVLAFPGEADSRIRTLFEQPGVAEIHAHNAAFGCFLARIERH